MSNRKEKKVKMAPAGIISKQLHHEAQFKKLRTLIDVDLNKSLETYLTKCYISWKSLNNPVGKNFTLLKLKQKLWVWTEMIKV